MIVGGMTRVRRLRSYHQAAALGEPVVAGRSSRLDELQAAVLRARLGGLPGALERLRELGRRYRSATDGLQGLRSVPHGYPEAGPGDHVLIVQVVALHRELVLGTALPPPDAHVLRGL